MSYDGAHSWLFHSFPHISRAHRANGKKTAMFMCRATDFQYVRGFLYENLILLPNPWTPKTSGQGQVSVGCLLGWEAEHSQSVHQPAPYGLVQNEAAVMSYVYVDIAQALNTAVSELAFVCSAQSLDCVSRHVHMLLLLYTLYYYCSSMEDRAAGFTFTSSLSVLGLWLLTGVC